MRIVECGQDSVLEQWSVDCVNILYICIYYTRVAHYVTVRVVQHQVTRLQGLTYGSTSFKLGDATGSTNRRLYATTGTITSPLVKTCPTGHYLVPTGDLRLQLDESVMLFIFLLTACCTSTNSDDDESAVAVSRTGAVCLSAWRLLASMCWNGHVSYCCIWWGILCCIINNHSFFLSQEWNFAVKGQPPHFCYYRLRSSASTVLTAIGQVNGRWRILTPHRIETHEPTAMKFRTIDYVRGRTP